MNSQWNKIIGWFDYSAIYDMAISRKHNNTIFVEVGAWFGKSTAYMAQKITNHDTLNFYAVDTWQGAKESETQKKIVKEHNNNIFPAFWQNMVNCEIQNYVKPIQLESTQAAKSFKDESIDFVFIDASHTYEAVLNDIKAWFPKVKFGGIIAGHDYHPKFGVIQAVNEFFLDNIQIISPKSHKLSDSWVHFKTRGEDD